MFKRLLLLLLIGATADVMAKDYFVSTPGTTMVLTAEVGKPLMFRYYGARADRDDVFSSYRAMNTQAFRAFGTSCVNPHACQVRFSDGDTSMNLVVESVSESEDKGLKSTVFTLRDTAHDFRVRVHYDACTDCNVMKLWSEYVNCGRKPVLLERFMSAALPVKSKECRLLTLAGNHGNECNEYVEDLGAGTRVISTQEGSRISSACQAAFMLGTDGELSEDHGNVIAGTLAWTGNFQLEFINNPFTQDPVMIFAGINPTASAYTLDAGKTLATPELILTYSTSGRGDAMRSFHFWARRHQVLDGTVEREVLLNSWEGVHLDTYEDAMHSLMDGAAAVGAEMFVMDDGWFGVKYPRAKDNAGLGDWTTDRNKLPNGVEGLVRYAGEKGLKFGIWIEPEMVNTSSELYDAHPDWVLRHQSFEPTVGRGKTQLLLDLTNPKVQDFVFGVVDNIMKENPGVSYIKWDHNMSIENAHSLYLPASHQSNLLVDYQLGLRSILERVRKAYPHLVIQLCSSGGFRLNYGFMPYFQEVWTSDQTDPLHRIYIQWGSLDFYPSNILAAHVCRRWSKYNNRYTPVKFRFDVASMCRLGLELVPSDMNDDERTYATRAIAAYKQIRPVVQQGSLYKLISPYDGNRDFASLMYVTDDGNRAVVFAYRMLYTRSMPERVIKFRGLNPEKRYLIREVCPEHEGKPVQIDGKVVSGRYLMTEGVVIRELEDRLSSKMVDDLRQTNDYRSVVLELVAQ